MHHRLQAKPITYRQELPFPIEYRVYLSYSALALIVAALDSFRVQPDQRQWGIAEDMILADLGWLVQQTPEPGHERNGSIDGAGPKRTGR